MNDGISGDVTEPQPPGSPPEGRTVMGLADEAEQFDNNQPGPECGMAKLVRLGVITFDELNEAYDKVLPSGENLSGSAIQKALKARWPDTPGEQSVNRHRRGICSCGPR